MKLPTAAQKLELVERWLDQKCGPDRTNLARRYGWLASEFIACLDSEAERKRMRDEIAALKESSATPQTLPQSPVGPPVR